MKHQSLKNKVAAGVSVACLSAAITFAAIQDVTTKIWDSRQYVDVVSFAQTEGIDFAVRASDPSLFRLVEDEHVLTFRVGSREAIFDGTRYWLSFPPRRDEEQLFLSRIDFDNLLWPFLRPKEVAVGEVKTIVIDAGHGGYDPGAQSGHGLEKEYTLDFAERIAKALRDERSDLRIKLTRKTDTFLPLDDRPVKANREDDALFVSVHLNSGPDTDSARGFEVFSLTPRGAPSTADQFNALEVFRTWPGNKRGKEAFLLADSVHRKVLSDIDTKDRGVKKARFLVLKKAEVPGILIEAGFLTNAEEADDIANPEWRQDLAESIAGGILEYVDSYASTERDEKPNRRVAMNR